MVTEETHAETVAENENPIEAVAGQFGLNGQIFVAQLINFAIVLLILWLFVYKPVIRLLDERKEKIEKSVRQADEIEKRMDELEKERDQILTAARKEAMTIAEKANEVGEARREEILVAAKREVERIITKGKTQLAQDKEAMLRELRKDIVDIALKATARILEDQVDERKSTSLAEEVVRKMT